MGQRALIVGLGIAGMAAAIGLRRAGWTPVIVERAPQRRTGGYFLGLFPEGREAAAELGIIEYLHTRNPSADVDTWSLDRRGNRGPGVGFLDQPGQPAAVLRGDVEAALWQAIDGVEVRFGTVPEEITQDRAGVTVLLRDTVGGTEYRETFNLVVGADGLRSTVRRLVFGPHEEFMTNWNAMICAFQLPAQAPTFAEQESVISAQAGRAVWIFGLSDRTPTTLLTYRTKDVDAEFAVPTAERLRTVFAGMDDPAVRHALDCLENAPEHLFDSVHQVRMPRWSQGRVVLIGDAAWCLNLYSGLGATSALKGGAALATALMDHPGDVTAALGAWEARLRPFITKEQRLTHIKRHLFVPSNRVTETIRTLGIRLINAKARRAAAKTRAPQPVTTGRR
ncbi:FAD-dependent monooxygenase [Paractinoplanes atraurantiacus]|uniref:2-polyprenyl-6-methoxyphenol hydroxylase n=1 Tax=Paractinoplanes atraurantiacus TaxID=1036182 RepID=A0A285H6X1_9ACTN|nr:FAD-dependent monooxygenase [Actinoplanes atraurantiacus]SNY31364.1 2-polyprenyl-6-methoxyphenol hydroxylase [Actinoplanes atraurantiacus]